MEPVTLLGIRVDHLVVEFVGVVFLILGVIMLIRMDRRQGTNARNIQALLNQAEIDHQARETAVAVLAKRAEDLDKRTAEAVAASDDKLNTLVCKLDHNTAMTIASGQASREAERTANSLNEKIADTNQRLIEAANRGLHQHITEVEDVSKATLQTAASVEHKVDALAPPAPPAPPKSDGQP